jgi:DNA-binding GntR family transcriptional regulator
VAEVITDPAGDETEEASKLATSPVVTTVFEQILAAVHTGELLPGQRISDAALAEQLGVSRTPVREALLRLREIGVIEASASRFTRVAIVTPIQTAQAFRVWLALYVSLLDEVIPGVPADLPATLEADHSEFLSSMKALDAQRIATANFMFFQRLVPLSRNPALQRAITSVVHVVRLGSLHLPEYVDLAALATSQELLIDAVRGRDLDAAHAAMAILRRIEIPLD